MSDYQEAKKTTSTAKNVQKTKSKVSEQNISLCPNCDTPLQEEALFCPECGFNLKTSYCPNCGEAVTEGADICAKCKAWLLEDQCKFCYTHLEHDNMFCPECGNPKDGIVCPDCGTLSIFDFCYKCGKPLTEGALLALENANNDPDAKSYVDAVKESMSIESEINSLNDLLNNLPASDGESSPPRKKSLFSERQISAIMKSGGNRDGQIQRKAEAEKKAEIFEKKREDEKRLKEIREIKARKEALEREKEKARIAAEDAQKIFKNKTFASHQDARRFHYASKPSKTVGWLCNFANIIHFDGPNGCDQPMLGGYWYDGPYETIQTSGPC